ncbi:Phospholipid/glycerol acyltransferase [Desulfamplus magnetovallimortis]|uniref:Phospholipid/glycerol acyltransferase n=1 Tax=Desulfamplus magnetovallimortis TaxID=1246637 RepID=A0A1W1HIK4_9BACT|nr:1-acyl-sn-glycerol-3-phosphate acyltransferase [Desulfamplus magnetovallimortis]SLM32309.1 Phospholipid/glycerol acyltransferase [Desulfamplus magnetovallimortis]
MKTVLSHLGKLIYRITGWSYDEIPAEEWQPKQLFIGFPHTSNMDTVMSFTYAKVIKVDAKVLIKSDWFFWPMSSFLNALGGIPIVREKGSGFVDNIIKEFKSQKKFILAIVPEGTRKKIEKIKTGFWNIAKGADVPVACWFFDNKRKKMTWVGHLIPGDNLVEDLLKLENMYKKHGYQIPLGDINQYKKIKGGQ